MFETESIANAEINIIKYSRKKTNLNTKNETCSLTSFILGLIQNSTFSITLPNAEVFVDFFQTKLKTHRKK